MVTGICSTLIETFARRRINFCSIQEHRLAGGTEANQTCVISGKYSKFKLYWSGCQQGTGGVGIFLSEKWIDKVIKASNASLSALCSSG